MPGFTEPNYTQTPNELFDILLPDMSESELKLTLAIIRLTLGFHKSECRASVPTLQQMTGLSHSSIWAGAELGEKRGTIRRHQEPGKTSEWELVLDPEAAKGYKKLKPSKYRGDKDQQPIQNLDPIQIVDDTHQATHQDFGPLSPVKEERNIKENIAPEAGGNSRTKDRLPGGTDAVKKGDGVDMAFLGLQTGDKTIQELVTQTFGIIPNWRTVEGRDFLQWAGGQNNSFAPRLEAFKGWWNTVDFRGKTGQPPTLSWIKFYWPQAMGLTGQASAQNIIQARD